VAFAVMRDLKMTHALTLDGHFREEGFVVLP
jgi:predicted nucleic acid-binding protein